MTEPDRPGWTAADQALMARRIMRRQGGLSLRIASMFLVLLLGLPLVNRFAPKFASQSVFGFPASWLFLGVLFYPITVALSVLFVRSSDRIEAQSLAEFRPAAGEDRR